MITQNLSGKTGGLTGIVGLKKDVGTGIAGREIVLVEDIIDTAETLHFLLGRLRARRPASNQVCTLLNEVLE